MGGDEIEEWDLQRMTLFTSKSNGKLPTTRSVEYITHAFPMQIRREQGVSIHIPFELFLGTSVDKCSWKSITSVIMTPKTAILPLLCTNRSMKVKITCINSPKEVISHFNLLVFKFAVKTSPRTCAAQISTFGFLPA